MSTVFELKLRMYKQHMKMSSERRQGLRSGEVVTWTIKVVCNEDRKLVCVIRITQDLKPLIVKTVLGVIVIVQLSTISRQAL